MLLLFRAIVRSDIPIQNPEYLVARLGNRGGIMAPYKIFISDCWYRHCFFLSSVRVDAGGCARKQFFGC